MIRFEGYDRRINKIQPVLEQYGLPTHISCPWDTVERAVGLDKKRAQGSISFVLLSRLGRADPVKMENERLLAGLKRLHEETV